MNTSTAAIATARRPALRSASLGSVESKPSSFRALARDSWAELAAVADDAHDEPSGVRPAAFIGEGKVVGGRYRIERHIARGGMGAVWEATDLEATDPRMSRVALKTMTGAASADEQSRERFRREVALAQSLVGKHFPRVSGFGVDRGVPYLALELLEGETLAARCEREGRLSIDACRWISRELATALGEAHALGIVHRDVTPKNIFIVSGPDGDELKLLDLGIAKHDLFGTKLTATGMLVGSPHYMSPEQVANVDVGYRTDLWSAAIVLYRALTGRRPFPGATGMDVLAAALRQPALRATGFVAELGADVDAFFDVALAKKAANRFVSAGDMATAFERATAHLVGDDVMELEVADLVQGDDERTVIARRDYIAFAAVASRESAAELSNDEPTMIAVVEDSTGDVPDAPTMLMSGRSVAYFLPPVVAPLRRPVAVAAPVARASRFTPAAALAAVLSVGAVAATVILSVVS